MCFAVGFAPTFAENIKAGSFRDVAGSLVPRPQQGRVHQQHAARHCDFVVHPLLMSVLQFALCSLPKYEVSICSNCVVSASSKRFVARNSAGLRGCACRRSEGVQILSDVSEKCARIFHHFGPRQRS